MTATSEILEPFPETRFWRFVGSVRLAVVLLLIASFVVLIGAWCPQEAQMGRDKVVEQFGEQTTRILEGLGVTDIFHTPFFLCLIALLSVNLTVASLQKVFPKALSLKFPLPFLEQH